MSNLHTKTHFKNPTTTQISKQIRIAIPNPIATNPRQSNKPIKKQHKA